MSSNTGSIYTDAGANAPALIVATLTSPTIMCVNTAAAGPRHLKFVFQAPLAETVDSFRPQESPARCCYQKKGPLRTTRKSEVAFFVMTFCERREPSREAG